VSAAPIVVDRFCPFAAQLRDAFDAHFADPYAMHMQSHGVWNYWYVPGKYTYLRSAPAKVLGEALAQRFLGHLRDWALRHTGLVPVSPLLSLYVSGCHQALHNDAANGRLGFVYSLTNWTTRKFEGGETLLLGDGALHQSDAPAGRDELFDLVEPQFDRLLLFDDRRPHGVAPVAGPMDPRQGRVVLHGHLVEQGVQLLEGKPDAALRQNLDRAVAMAQAAAARRTGLHGVATFRLDVNAQAAAPHLLLDLVNGDHAERAVDDALKLLATIGPTTAPCSLIVPLSFGAPPRGAS
jgi:hypothetical protein